MRYFLLIFNLLLWQFTAAQKVEVVKHASQADVKVYVTNIEHEADVKVFKVKYPILAEGNKGKWFFGNSTQADIKIMFVNYTSQADIKIYYVKYESLAGWVNNKKRNLLKK